MMEFFDIAIVTGAGLVFSLLLPNDTTGMNIIGQYLVSHKTLLIFMFGCAFGINFIGAMASEVVKPEQEGDDNV